MMYLSSYSFIEPDEKLYLYYPGWLNVWESHSYNKALKATGASSWGFKRFGSTEDIYSREITRRADHIPYINALDKVADTALHELSAKERMRLLKSRTAFIYIDSWGESAVFEYNISSLHLSTIDTLPKNLVKKFSVQDVTCKVRGENYSFVQAMQLAQDYLTWNIFDYVVICGGYRAIPLLDFTGSNIHFGERENDKRSIPCINISIERVGCFIFSQRESNIKINCGSYVRNSISEILKADYVITHGVDFITYSGSINKSSDEMALPKGVIDLVNLYGYSGCMTPALSWQYIASHPSAASRIRTIIQASSEGYTYFDTWI